MTSDQLPHGGAADGYYQQGQQDIGMQQPQDGAYNQAYNQQPRYEAQQPYLQEPQGPQQYPHQPPKYPPEQYPDPAQGSGVQDEKHGFEQRFKLECPKYNDLWAAILFIATFLGFAAISGLTIYGYSHTKSRQGSGIYNSSSTSVALNTNTIILL
jgi:hypothetical protein